MKCLPEGGLEGAKKGEEVKALANWSPLKDPHFDLTGLLLLVLLVLLLFWLFCWLLGLFVLFVIIIAVVGTNFSFSHSLFYVRSSTFFLPLRCSQRVGRKEIVLNKYFFCG